MANSEMRAQAEEALAQQEREGAQLAVEQAAQSERNAEAWRRGAAAAMQEGYETAAAEIVSLRLQLGQMDEEKAALSRKLASQRILNYSRSHAGTAPLFLLAVLALFAQRARGWLVDTQACALAGVALRTTQPRQRNTTAFLTRKGCMGRPPQLGCPLRAVLRRPCPVTAPIMLRPRPVMSPWRRGAVITSLPGLASTATWRQPGLQSAVSMVAMDASISVTIAMASHLPVMPQYCCRSWHG